MKKIALLLVAPLLALAACDEPQNVNINENGYSANAVEPEYNRIQD